MGLLDRLIGGRKGDGAAIALHPDSLSGRLLALPQDNFVKVVGESHYQDALRSLAPKCVPGRDGRPSFPVSLMPEPENVHDRHAIAVHASTGKVGYLSREDAARYSPTFEALRQAGYDGASCTGLLNGGDRHRPSFGVVLTVAYPEVCESHLQIPQDVVTPPSRGRGSGGELRGHHYTEYVEEVKALRRAGEEEEAERLLLELVQVVETEAAVQRWGVAPWYYEQLAIIYRKRKDPQAEVAILERYDAAPHAPGAAPAKLRSRLEKARQLAGPT